MNSHIIFQYLWQSFKCFCLFVICVSYSSTVVKFLCGTHLKHLSGAANTWNKRILSLLMWLPYSAATSISFFIFNPVAWNFFLTRNMWFRLEYSSIFLYLKNSLVNSIVYTVRMPEFVQEFSPLQLIATVFKITDTLHSNVTDPACFESKILVSVKLGRKLAYLRNSNKKSRVIF